MMRPSKTRLLIAHLILWSVILGLVITIAGLLSLEASKAPRDPRLVSVSSIVVTYISQPCTPAGHRDGTHDGAGAAQVAGS